MDLVRSQVPIDRGIECDVVGGVLEHKVEFNLRHMFLHPLYNGLCAACNMSGHHQKSAII